MTYRPQRLWGLVQLAGGGAAAWGGFRLADLNMDSPVRFAFALLGLLGLGLIYSGLVFLCEKVRIDGEEIHWTRNITGGGYIHRAYIDNIDASSPVRILNKDGDWIVLPATSDDAALGRALKEWWSAK